MNKNNDVIMFAAGDVGPDRDKPGSIFEHVTELLKTGDVNFCQLEPPLSHTTDPKLVSKGLKRDPKIVAKAIKEAGFNVISSASNHCLDAGVEAFLETIDILNSEKLKVIGVGRNIFEARKPAIVECKGNRIAFLGYNSVGASNYWATPNKLGCAPLRAWTLYDPIEPVHPGCPARAITFPYREDLADMISDIKNAKSQADIVIVSIHCGLLLTPAKLAEYQIDYAHAAIDAGADLILQHHAHILKGIEVYNGKVIFYGLGNFAIEVHFMTKEWAALPMVRESNKTLNPDWDPPYEDYPSFPFPPDSRKTIMVKCVISDKSIKRVTFLPAIINHQSQPEILASRDNRFQDVIKYVDKISSKAGFRTIFKADGEEVLIKG